jgi:hypothetical protein
MFDEFFGDAGHGSGCSGRADAGINRFNLSKLE